MESVWRKYNSPSLVKSGDDVGRVTDIVTRWTPKADGVVELDTVVVGGGIAGVMCAYMLSKNGHDVTLIEAGKILEGVTASTTAHVTALQGKYSDIPTARKRRLYFSSQTEAVRGIESLVRKHNIDCDFELVDGFVFGARKDIKKEFNAMRRFTPNLEHLINAHLPFGIHDCIRLPEQAQFNPIKFCRGLVNSAKFDIIENCSIKKVCLMRRKLKTEVSLRGGKADEAIPNGPTNKVFKYNRLVLATGFPIVNIRGLYAFKMYKSFSYAVCADVEQEVGAIYNSIAGDGLTYRDSSDGLIIGGLDHRTGRFKCNHYFDILKREFQKFGNVIPSAAEGSQILVGSVRKQRSRYNTSASEKVIARLGSARDDYAWAANDCMTFDGVPYAGRLLRFRARRSAFVISGFGKWGMTNSFICAKIVDDLINRRRNIYARLFKPTRVLNITVWPKFLWNFLQDGLGLLAGLFSSGKRKCPHMGCRLKFNPNTQTYDCPCHGSRFTKSGGDIITSPAVDANPKIH